MATIVTIGANDEISDSRANINDNFSALNTDKIETSYLDTDTTLAANSDSKIATQRAVKAFVEATAGTTFLVPTGAILPYGAASAPSNYLLCDGSAVSRATYVTLFGVIGTTYGSGDGSTTFNVPNLKSAFPLGSGQRTETFTFDGASAVDPTTDEITVSSNQWLQTGQAVALTGSSLPTGLSATTYYVIRQSATVIKLATSLANAIAGTAVDITADGSGTCTLTLTLTSRALGDEGGEENHGLTTSEIPAHQHYNNAFQSAATGSQTTTNSFDTTSTAVQDAGTVTSNTGGSTAHNNMPPYVVVNYIIKT